MMHLLSALQQTRQAAFAVGCCPQNGFSVHTRSVEHVLLPLPFPARLNLGKINIDICTHRRPHAPYHQQARLAHPQSTPKKPDEKNFESPVLGSTRRFGLCVSTCGFGCPSHPTMRYTTFLSTFGQPGLSDSSSSMLPFCWRFIDVSMYLRLFVCPSASSAILSTQNICSSTQTFAKLKVRRTTMCETGVWLQGRDPHR